MYCLGALGKCRNHSKRVVRCKFVWHVVAFCGRRRESCGGDGWVQVNVAVLLELRCPQLLFEALELLNCCLAQGVVQRSAKQKQVNRVRKNVLEECQPVKQGLVVCVCVHLGSGVSIKLFGRAISCCCRYWSS